MFSCLQGRTGERLLPFYRFHLADIVFLIANNDNILHQHRYLEAVFVLDKHDVLALEATHSAASHLGEEAHLVAYLHSIARLIYWHKGTKKISEHST